MSTINTWTLATEDLEHIMNKAKDALLSDLAKSNIISMEQQEELSKTKMIIIREKSKISIFFSKLLKKDEQEYPSIMVGIIKNLESSDGNKE